MLAELPLGIRRQIDEGVFILRRGGIVAFPTDTVYGLGAGVMLTRAVERVYQVKERPRNIAFPLLLACTSQFIEVADSMPPVAWFLVRNFLPGALTLILRKSNSVPDIVTGGGMTVAVRIPAHPVPIALADGLGMPIVGTSANISGKPSALTAEEVYSQFGDKIDLVIDGGRSPGGRESTIVDVTEEIPMILREGAISKEELRRVCGDIVFKEGD
jgi:L-threonylcarbamoyladenylate synthase